MVSATRKSIKMSAPLPIDPLDEPIIQLGHAIDEFLATNVDFEKATPTNSLAGVKRNLLKHYRTVVRADKEFDQGLRQVQSLGSTILDLTDDQHIVGPVTDLIRLTSEIRAEIGQLKLALRDKVSVWRLMGVSVLMKNATSSLNPRMAQIAAERDKLTAYYLLRMPPRDSA